MRGADLQCDAVEAVGLGAATDGGECDSVARGATDRGKACGPAEWMRGQARANHQQVFKYQSHTDNLGGPIAFVLSSESIKLFHLKYSASERTTFRRVLRGTKGSIRWKSEIFTPSQGAVCNVFPPLRLSTRDSQKGNEIG